MSVFLLLFLVCFLRFRALLVVFAAVFCRFSLRFLRFAGVSVDCDAPGSDGLYAAFVVGWLALATLKIFGYFFGCRVFCQQVARSIVVLHFGKVYHYVCIGLYLCVGRGSCRFIALAVGRFLLRCRYARFLLNGFSGTAAPEKAKKKDYPYSKCRSSSWNTRLRE